jgi:hypothetical protein
MPATELPVIGWREWVALPDLGIPAIKAKVDTGARSSTLHAVDIELFRRGETHMVRFKVYPFQRDRSGAVTAEAVLLGRRLVRSSSGQEEFRPIIRTSIDVMGRTWPIYLTLARRGAMGFRMLLGRRAVRRKFLLDPGHSFLAGKAKVPLARRRARKPAR